MSDRVIFVAWLVSATIVGCGPTEPDNPVVSRPAIRQDQYRDGKLVLGSPSLTAGIPGSGPLTVAEIKSWLADDRNHQPLDFALPIGLIDAESRVAIPADNRLTRAKIELGRQLFFDQRLSGLGQNHAAVGAFSCAVCHQPQQHFSSYQIMPEVGRNASAAFNRLFSREQFWDGKASSLESQPIVPIENPFEMNTTPAECTERIAAIDGYRLQLEAIFGAVSFENIGRALASFQRALVTGPSAWDYQRLARKYERVDVESLPPPEREAAKQVLALAASHPMSAAARRGEEIFFSDRARCGACHVGPNLTDESYHNIGVGLDREHPDLGRYRVTLRDEDIGAFKTPTLRNVAKTAPYMHNGQFTSLREVIDWFCQGGLPNEHLSGEIEPLDLSDAEKNDLVAFLEALDCPLPPVETGRLPE